MTVTKLLLSTALVTIAMTATAQDNAKKVIYKWQQSGRIHYAEWPPHGINNYQRLNDQGMVLSEIPDLESFLVIRPERPTTQADKSQDQTDNNALTPNRPGTITRQKRCETAQKNLKVINEKQTIYEEDQSGNLMPLTAEEVAKRREQAQSEVASFCSEAPSK